MKAKALKPVSTREMLATTVRLLTKTGVQVQFRGSKAMVQTKGDKVVRMVLPECSDAASDELIAALHGYLDHECGHMFFTPFGKFQKFTSGFGKGMQKILNIVEDIRLEKLLPRQLPGTKVNLERLYDKVIPEVMRPHAAEMIAKNNPSVAFAGVMVPGLRALSGQKTFQKFMDDDNLWPHFAPLLAVIPDLSRLLRDMETPEDAQVVAEKIYQAIVAQPKPDPAQDPDEKGDQTPDFDIDAEDEDEEQPEDEQDQGGEPEDDAEGEGDEDSESDDGEGHGDGEGTDDEKGDEDDTDAGDASDDEGGNGDDTDGESKPDKSDDDTDDGDEGNPTDEDTGDESTDHKSGGGKTNVSITDALKQLEPTQRRAIFEYKKNRKSIEEIAEILEVGDSEVRELIRTGRRRIHEIMAGD